MNKLDKLANALQLRVIEHLDNLSIEDVCRLGIYLGNEVYSGVKPDNVQRIFVDKFIQDFDKFIDEQSTEKCFTYTRGVKLVIIEITSYITYYATRKLYIVNSNYGLEKAKHDLLKVNIPYILAKNIILNENKLDATDILISLVNEFNLLGLTENIKNDLIICIESLK